MFKALVVALLSVIAAGVVYLAVRETPGEKVLRAADELVAPRATTRAAEARQTTARADSSNLFQALKLYKLDTKRYPTEAEGLAVLVAGSPRPYLDKLPTDPWGHPYQYANPGTRGVVEVFSMGADGKANTEDDIGSWQP